MIQHIVFIILIILSTSFFQNIDKINYQTYEFGKRGQIKMLYDRRQRPQSVYLNGKVHVVFNAGAEEGATGQSKTTPMIVTYNPQARQFSDILPLGKSSKDHHDGPVIWTDLNDHLHVLFGCHKTPGTHLISKKPGKIGASLDDWKVAAQIAPGISYPTFYCMVDGKELVYYRTEGHTSSWTYRISNDNGKTWKGPENDVTDMDSKGRFEWSSYQTTLPSNDGRFLHVAFIDYDDNKQRDPERYYNPRYKKAVSNEWKYNLHYLKIDVTTEEVFNFEGKVLNCPIDIDYAMGNTLIWNTEGRGAGVPPDIVIDENGNPAFLHVLSEENTETHNYYFVRTVNGKWEKTIIAPSNHQWNSCHIQLDGEGIYHAFLVTGEKYIDTEWVEGKSIGDEFEKGKTNYIDSGGFMDKHGGGRIEEWISADKGATWRFLQDLTPDPEKYPGWRFNNIQPVTRPDGSIVEGMLLFYGWNDKNAPDAKAFLLHEK